MSSAKGWGKTSVEQAKEQAKVIRRLVPKTIAAVVVQSPVRAESASPTRASLIECFGDVDHESPMEKLFWAGCAIAAAFYGKPEGLGYGFQVQADKHRVDFMFSIDDKDVLVVEIDGHDWHEKTKEQAARDKARDRCLVEKGLRVARFTGAEVWDNPIECALQVFRIVEACR